MEKSFKNRVYMCNRCGELRPCFYTITIEGKEEDEYSFFTPYTCMLMPESGKPNWVYKPDVVTITGE